MVRGGVLRTGQVATASCSAVECHFTKQFVVLDLAWLDDWISNQDTSVSNTSLKSKIIGRQYE